MDIKRIAILGSGSMGTAILSGLLASGFDSAAVTVSTKSQASATNLADQLGVLAYSLEVDSDANASANSKAVHGADVVLVAVKPAYVVETLREVASSLSSHALVISVAAGIKTESMQDALPHGVRVIRAMPNTPAIVGRAVTGIAPGALATEADLNLAVELFETVGNVAVIDEGQIDALSTISGSGPAYVFYFMEQLTAAAMHQGFTREQAELLVQETFLGAAELVMATGADPEQLRRQVTSPNGTTERAIATFDQAKLRDVFIAATDAALARAREIASGA